MKKNKFCLGCGVKLQDENILNIGFVTNLEQDYCMRCFRLKNYGEYESVSSNYIDYQKIIDGINKTKDLVLYVVDLLNVPEDLMNIRKLTNNDCLLVFNKRDLLPLSIKDEKILDYFKKMELGYQDILIVSSEKNIGMDNLMNKIKKWQHGKNVFVVGYTNAGKSSLITKIIHDYSEEERQLTIAPLPSTTLNNIKIPITEKLNLIDTPGIIDNTNIINHVDKKMYKKLNSKKEIHPKTFQVTRNQALIVDDLFRINYLEGDLNSFTFYTPNEIKVKRLRFRSDKLLNLTREVIDVKYGEDLVISGLGFIKIVAGCQIELFINKDINVFTRKSMI